jgi:hypothetical protein
MLFLRRSVNMDAIPMEELETNFIVTDANIRLGELAQALRPVPEERRTAWYIVVHLPEGGFAAVNLADLGELIEAPEPEIGAMSLQDVPGLLVSSRAVERVGQGVGEASRVMRRSPRRRLVVLDQGAPVGLLVSEYAAGGFGGVMTTLFGEEQERFSITQGVVKVHCQACGQAYDFVDVIDLSSGNLVCPEGHGIVS